MSTTTTVPSAWSSARTTACATGWRSASRRVLMALFTFVLLVQVLFRRPLGYDTLGRRSSRRSG